MKFLWLFLVTLLAGCGIAGMYTKSQVLNMNAVEIHKVRDYNLCKTYYEPRSTEVVNAEVRRRRLDCRAVIVQNDDVDPGPDRRAAAAAPPRPRKAAVEIEAPVPTASPVPPPTVQQGQAPPPQPPAQAARGRTPPTNARRPDGLIAQNCVLVRRADGAKGASFAKNACGYTVEARGACLPSYADEDEPFPGTYSLDSWLLTLRPSQEQSESKADACLKRGGKVLYVACRIGIAYFTAPDASKYGCFR